MSRISCEPCEIIVTTCDCCHEILCSCSKNKVELCEDPCFPKSEAHMPGGAPLPFLIEGMVPDVNFNISYTNHTRPGPLVSSIISSGWDTNHNLFSYEFVTDASTHLSAPGSYRNDSSACKAFYNELVPNHFLSDDENLSPQINKLVNELLGLARSNFDGYIPSGIAGGPVFPQSPDPYNEIPFYVMKNNLGFINQSLSDRLKNSLDLINHKTVTSYNFKGKYKTAIFKSILFGYFEKFFSLGAHSKIGLIEDFSREVYRNKAVPSLDTNPASSLEYPYVALPVNLGNAKTYIGENRIRFNTQAAGQRLTNQILRQYWKFVPSDINLRARVYRNVCLSAPYAPGGIGIVHPSGPGTNPVDPAGIVGQRITNTLIESCADAGPADQRVWSVKVNDDDTISTYKTDGTVARVHYINAEYLRVFNNSGAHIPASQNTGGLDPTPRYQTGCGCCTSGCFITLCSDRNNSYVFDTMDRSVLLGVLGAVSGFNVSSFDTDPYIELSVSTPFTTGPEQFPPTYPGYNSNEIKSFYLLQPALDGTDILSGIVDPSNSYVQTTNLEYKIVAYQYTLGDQKAVDRAVRYISGPGNTLFISNDDPILYHLSYLANRGENVSATIPDLNINGILERVERYPRRIPYHMLIVPTDQPLKNPLFGKSKITSMLDWNEGDGVRRTIKMVPAPTHDVLNSSYLDLVEYKEATLYNGWLPNGYGESDNLPFGPQGTSTHPYKMQFSASDPQASFNVWASQLLEEVDRRVDPVPKVFKMLSDVSSYYYRRTGTLFGLYPTSPETDSIYPIYGDYSLPLFDVWRSLNMFEFHEFLTSFRNDIFERLMEGKFRGTQLFYSPTRWPEKTYLHTYVPGHPTWKANAASLAEFSGTASNPRNASGVALVEDSLFMDKVKERIC